MKFSLENRAKSPLRFLFFVLLSVGTTSTAMAQAARKSKWYRATMPNIVDVQLGANNVLRGSTEPGARIVTVLKNGDVVARSPVDRQGWFEIQPLSGGQYYLTTGRTGQSIRAWAPKTAPPSSTETLRMESLRMESAPADPGSIYQQRKQKFIGRPAWQRDLPPVIDPDEVRPAS